MPQWAPFLAVIAVLTIVVLALARQSQRIVHEYSFDGDAPGEGPDCGAVDPDVADATGTDDFGGSRRPAPDNDATIGHPTDPPVGADDPADIDSMSDGSADPGVELTTGALLANVAVTQGVVALVVLGAVWYFSIPADALGVTAAQPGTASPAIAVGLGFGAALWAGNELSTSVADVVGAAYDERLRGLLAPDSAAGWALLLGGALPIVAVSEELLFRAALIGVPAAGFGVSPWLLAVVSSVVFALGHGAQGRVGVVVTGGLGFVLAAGYVLSGSLLLVVVAHYVVNALEFLLHELFSVPWLESATASS